jgi:hypothetical protein
LFKGLENLDIKAIEKALTEAQLKELKAFNLGDVIDKFNGKSYDMD